MKKISQQKETALALLEYLPELLLVITDVVILAGAGHRGEVAGASVAAILLGAVIRMTRPISGVVGDLAEKHPRLRKEILGISLGCAAVSTLGCAVLWAARAPIGEFVGLPGVAEYLTFAAPYKAVIRWGVIGYRALGVNQARIKSRVALAWGGALSNVGFTAWLVPEYGAAGASAGTLLAEIVPTGLVLYWTYKDKLVTPSLRWLPHVWKRAKRKTAFEVPAMINSVMAMLVNRWLGKELALVWTLSHVACDVVGGVVRVMWGMAAKHWRYNKADRALREAAWEWGDRVGCACAAIGVVGSALVTPMAPLIVAAYCVGARYGCKVNRPSSEESNDLVADGKLAWALACILGYGVCVFSATPDVWAITAVYCTAAVAKVFAMRR
jgi:hypothetical protein